MSKESRRRQRQAGRVPASAPTTTRPAGATGPTAPTHSTGPRGSVRAGRRERARPYDRPSLFQRYRTILLGAALLVVVAVVGAGVFAAATEKAYACSSVWVPSPTPSPRESAAPQPGYVQPDMGRGHVPVGTKVTYTYCPPASGRHYAAAGAGPLTARVYGPNDTVIPDGWIHNLEHGGLVVLYKGGEVDQAALRTLFDAVPASPICGFEPGGQSPGPVIARFDDMAWPYAAIVWGRVLPLETLDEQAIVDFYAASGERTNPEQQCTAPSAAPSSSETPSSSPATSAEPSASAGSSAAPSTPAASGGAVAPSAPASASPS